MRALVVGLGVLLVAVGCASDPKSGSGGGARDMTEARPPGGPESPSEEERLGGVQQRDPARWEDKTEGELSTLVYVTEMRGQRGNQPGAMIFGSDPGSAHFRRRATPLFVVRRLTKSEMTWLREDLHKLGLDDLPWIDEPDYDSNIGPARGLHLYANSKRRYVLKDGLGTTAKRDFRRIEDRLLKLTFLR
ncbi:MAG: hypothetical protein JKY65_26675 [Planctomycetes bacterium]|nr:hypothetical protein [Planctomycetota bacterium]